MKIAILVVLLVKEAEKYSNKKLEEEILNQIDIAKIPWGGSLIKAFVFNGESANRLKV